MKGLGSCCLSPAFRASVGHSAFRTYG